VSTQYDNFNIRSLGPLEAKVILSAEESGDTIIDVERATSILGNRQQAIWALIRLERKGWLQRITPGKYAIYPAKTGAWDARIMSSLKFAASIVEPCYVGWWAAAQHHGLTWQSPSVICVAALKQVRFRMFEHARIEFIKIKPEKFFDIVTDAVDDFPVSSIPKTIVDCVDRPKLAGGAAEVGIILGTGLEKTDAIAVVEAAIRNGSVSAMQRLGFYLDTVRPDLFSAEARGLLKARIGKASRSAFGRTSGESGDFGYQSDWQLQVNIDRQSFMAEVDRFGVYECSSKAAST